MSSATASPLSSWPTQDKMAGCCALRRRLSISKLEEMEEGGRREERGGNGEGGGGRRARGWERGGIGISGGENTNVSL